MEGETGNYHFAVNGKSYQVIIKHFYSLLPKGSSEATKHLCALPVLLSGSGGLAGERCFSISSRNVITSHFDSSKILPPCLRFNLNSLLSASSKTSDDRGAVVL